VLTRLQLPKDTLFLYAGEFGRAVLAELDTHGSTVLPAEEPTYVASLPFARLIITAWPGERFDDRDRVDSVAFFRKIPSLGLSLTPSRITCGPLVRPGASACYSCYHNRRLQHERRTTQTSGFADSLDEGFGAPDIAIAVGMLHGALVELSHPAEGIGGTVREFNLVHGMTSRYNTVAIDRCPRCSHRFSDDRELTAAFSTLIN